MSYKAGFCDIMCEAFAFDEDNFGLTRHPKNTRGLVWQTEKTCDKEDFFTRAESFTKVFAGCI